MSYIPKKCPICGANLDPGESCDCESTTINEVRKGLSLPPLEDIPTVSLDPTWRLVGDHRVLVGIDLASALDFMSKEFNLHEENLEATNHAGEQ